MVNADFDPRRKDDVSIAMVALQLDNFIERYDRDLKETKDWRDKYEVIQQQHTNVLNEIAPNFRRGIWVFCLIVVGSIGIIVTKFWNHIAWN